MLIHYGLIDFRVELHHKKQVIEKTSVLLVVY